MGTLSSCLKKIGLPQHEAAILRGATDDNINDGDEKHVAAVRAVSDFIEQLEKERDSIAAQIAEKNGRITAAPFKLSDLAHLTSVLRASTEEAKPQEVAETAPAQEAAVDSNELQTPDLLNARSDEESAEAFKQQVDEQYAKFLAGDFSSPSYISGTGKEGREIAKESSRLKSLVYAVAAKRFLEGELVTKVPGKRDTDLNTEFIEDVQPNPISKKLAKVKDFQSTLKALNEIAADEKELRYYLRGVHFDESGKLVATDGYRMVYVDGVDTSSAPSKPDKQEAGHSYTVLGRDGQWIDGKFPDWQRVMPDHKTQTESFDMEYLGNVARGLIKAQRYTNRSKYPLMRLTIGGIESSLNAEFIADMADLFRKFGYSNATISIVPGVGNGIVATSEDGKIGQRIMGMRDDPTTFAKVSSSGYVGEGKVVGLGDIPSVQEAGETETQEPVAAVNAVKEPNPLDYTPKQYHEAYMAYVAKEYDLSPADVKQDYDTEAARKERNQEWINAVRAAARDGVEISRQTLDKLHELNDKAVAELMHDYPQAKIPEGYQTPAARSVEKQNAEGRKEDRKAIREQKEEAPEPVASQQIEDFGQKLEGARKDRAPSLSREISDDEIATQPLSKIWPTAEIDDIENKFAAAVAYAARNEIPSKPRVSYKVARWVEKVKILRGLASKIVNIGEERAREIFANAMAGSSDFRAKVALLEAIDRNQWSRIDTVGEHPSAYRYFDGEKVAAPSVRVEIDGKNHFFEGAKSVADVVEKVNGLLGVEQQAKKMQFEVRGRGNSFSINKKGDKEYRKLKTFETTKEAFEFIKNNYDDLVSAWEDVKERDNVTKDDIRNDENRQRTGKDWRNGKDITPEEFSDALGFRGIQFGNWVSQGKGGKDRQGMLNQAYDALMDLASIVGVPPKAMSLNGSLGLAFGARGSGKFAAHFEPDTLVINLTKTRGAGSLAHEWFHALDNYFSRQRGGEVPIGRGLNAQDAYRAQNYITYRPEPMYVHKSAPTAPMTKAQLERNREAHPKSGFFAAENWMLDPKHPQGVRPEVERAFAELVEALDASPMKIRAAKNDKTENGYWSRIIERGARAFENFVIFKMMENGYNNDYLANVRNIEDFPRAKERYPYLLPEEVAPIAEAFDNLFSTVETKETDQGIAIYNKEEGKALPESEWLPTAQIVDQVDHLLQQFKTEIPVTIIDHEGDVLPDSAVGDDGWATSGFVYRGRIHLVRSGMASPEAVVGTLFHELLHFGIRRFVPEKQYIAHMMALYQADPWIQAKTEAWLDTADGLEVARKYGAEIAAARGVDEALAELAEQLHAERTAPGVTVGGRLAEVAKNVINWLKKLAKQFGWNAVAERLDDLAPGQQSKDYVESIFKKLREGDNPPFSMTSTWAYSDPAFMVSNIPLSLTDFSWKRSGSKANDPILVNGSADLVQIPIDVQIRTQGRFLAKPVRLLNGKHSGPHRGFGAAHVAAEHAKDANAYGVDPTRYAIGVVRSATRILDDGSGRLILSSNSSPRGQAYVELRDHGGFYSVVTVFGGIERGKLIWSGRKLILSSQGSGDMVETMTATTGQSGSPSARTDQSPINPKRPLEPLADQINKPNIADNADNEKFSLGGGRSANTNKQTRSALTERFGERGIRALEKTGMLKITTVANAPESIRAAAERENASALYFNGTAYIFSDRISPDQAPAKLLHELGEHYGIESMLGKDGWNRMMKRVTTMAKARGSIAKAAWDGVKDKYREFDGLSDEQLATNDRFIHEVVAKIGENEQGQKTSLWRELLAKLKDWLASLGIMTESLNEGDIVNLVNGSLKKVMKDAEAGLVEKPIIGDLVVDYFKSAVAAMEANNQLVKDCF